MKSKSAAELAQLQTALRSLRLVAKEIGQNYVAALQADIARLERLVSSRDGDKALRPADLALMLRLLHALEVKPHKGRRRDLKAIDKLVTRLDAAMEDWE